VFLEKLSIDATPFTYPASSRHRGLVFEGGLPPFVSIGVKDDARALIFGFPGWRMAIIHQITVKWIAVRSCKYLVERVISNSVC